MFIFEIIRPVAFLFEMSGKIEKRLKPSGKLYRIRDMFKGRPVGLKKLELPLPAITIDVLRNRFQAWFKEDELVEMIVLNNKEEQGLFSRRSSKEVEN